MQPVRHAVSQRAEKDEKIMHEDYFRWNSFPEYHTMLSFY